ncbi:hypothetical protein RA272_29005, partial [Pseudomonas syringae pv. tagetis]|uniref:hypothetical protein n=1 Tax=Pseudomonas syringae group genomosp. 7 TaxID=251699 RepID=UPI00377063D4
MFIGIYHKEQAGLYVATGAMRVWSGIFQRLPSAPLRVSNKGLDWQSVAPTSLNTTDEGCP